VPKLQAVKNIVANPDQFRADLPLINNHPYFQSVTLTRDMDVELAARLADVQLDDFKALNPQLSRPVILAAGTPQILLPWDNATVFKRNFEAYDQGKFATWTAWSAPSHHDRRAKAARRVGMNENELRTVNSIPPRMLIKAGSVLIVPRKGNTQGDVTSHLADNGTAEPRTGSPDAPHRGQGGQARHRGQHRRALQAQRRPGGRMERRGDLGVLPCRPAGRPAPAGANRRPRAGSA
jgi:hypothetical protein